MELRAAKIDEPVSKYQSLIDNLAAKKKNIDRLAKLRPSDAIDKLDAALDKVAQVYATVQGNVLGPVADTLTSAAGELQQVYTDINDAVCAAKQIMKKETGFLRSNWNRPSSLEKPGF